MQPSLREYLTKLRLQAFLQIRAGYIDSGAAAGKDTTWQDPATLKPQTVTKEEVAMRTRHRRLLFVVPIPGTKIGGVTTGTAASAPPPAKAPPAASVPPTAASLPPGTPGSTPNQQIPGSAPVLPEQK
jgi:hypothetical protein